MDLRLVEYVERSKVKRSLFEIFGSEFSGRTDKLHTIPSDYFGYLMKNLTVYDNRDEIRNSPRASSGYFTFRSLPVASLPPPNKLTSAGSPYRISYQVLFVYASFSHPLLESRNGLDNSISIRVLQPSSSLLRLTAGLLAMVIEARFCPSTLT